MSIYILASWILLFFKGKLYSAQTSWNILSSGSDGIFPTGTHIWFGSSGGCSLCTTLIKSHINSQSKLHSTWLVLSPYLPWPLSTKASEAAVD